MSHYTVGYHDLQNNHYEICEYAVSAYEAIEHSKEDVPYLHEHPSFVVLFCLATFDRDRGLYHYRIPVTGWEAVSPASR